MSITAGVSDCHGHLGVLPAQRFYEPVVPAGAAKVDVAELLAQIDGEDTERALIIPNYGVPDPDISFSFNELVVEARRPASAWPARCGLPPARGRAAHRAGAEADRRARGQGAEAELPAGRRPRRPRPAAP